MSIFKISLPGFNVHRSRINEEAINSLYSSPKVDTAAQPPHAGIIFLNWATSGIVMSNDTTKILYSFPHKYNYVPTALAACKFDNGSSVLYGTLPFQYGALGMITIDTDQTNVNLKYYSFDSASTTIPPFVMQIRFYVFAEPGY